MELLQGSPGLLAGLVFAFGLLVGSFLNVVILRLPPKLEYGWRRDAREHLELPLDAEPEPPGIVVRPSGCPNCGHRLAPWENIPLLSFALLRGRCRGCGQPISWQYPAVELLTGLLFLACALRFGATPQCLAALAFTGTLVALAGIDVRTQLLPDAITLPLLWLGLLLAATGVGFVDPVAAIAGAVAGYLSLWLVYQGFRLITGKEGMGFGDFKLLAALGAWCGGWAILPIVLMSSFIGAIVGGALMALQGQDRDVHIPFGPYLATAGWVQLLWGESLLQWYRNLSGLG
ncbi:prepilin peptidase [Arenimonas composti]|uniref:prepilin peptidase n=1 Tax=Arenimonas composti TaxID=370776 RepID=UPI003CCE0824